MPRLPDEVEAEHLMSADFSDPDGLPADSPTPAAFQAFHTRPKWSRSASGWGTARAVVGGGGVGGGMGGMLWAAGLRVNDVLLRFQVRSPRAVIFLLAGLKFSFTTTATLLMIPVLRLIEDGICHKHYGVPVSEPIPEMKCKADEVQKSMAWLFGWQSLLAAVVNMIVAFPYGTLSDRIGRKACLLLAFLGTILSFAWAPVMLGFFPHLHIYFLCAGIVFTFVGGGIIVLFNNVYAMAADVSTETDRASNFVCLSVGAVVGGLVGPLSAGFLMERYGPWVPIRLVFFLSPFVFLTVVLLPETLRQRQHPQHRPQQHRPQQQQQQQHQQQHHSQQQKPLDALPLADAVREAFRTALRELHTSAGMLRDRNVLLCLAPSLVAHALASSQHITLSQFVSKHFGWTLAQTSFLLSPLGFLHLGILAVLPRLSRTLLSPTGRFRCTGWGKDALLAKVSFLVMALGTLVMGCSWEIVVFVAGLTIATLGSASGPLTRAIVTEFVDAEQTSRLYALTSMVETLGSPLGGPVLAWAFSVGLERKGALRGLPYLYVSMLAALTCCALMFVREPRKKGPIHLGGDDADVEGLDYESGAED
ncbi:Efflux pump ustT [Colletotrichum spinosum]|uniref:Efflux pump ustT n=1 Tax=Colletotrichum spinosum TaxID=1347390 RepID=A0A4R8Q2Y6_9PEZI|nr:Efflux pump ustT [Colletotrichum spinosum]